MRKVTAWTKNVASTGERYVHNHIEDGCADGDRPKPIKPEFINQKNWINYN